MIQVQPFSIRYTNEAVSFIHNTFFFIQKQFVYLDNVNSIIINRLYISKLSLNTWSATLANCNVVWYPRFYIINFTHTYVWYMLVSRSASLCASDRPWIAAIEGYCMLYCSVSASKYLYERLNAGVNAPSHNVCRK